MKDFVSALINRHVQTADHVKPRTRAWFDNTVMYEDVDNEEQVVDEANAPAAPALTLNRTSESETEEVIVPQHSDHAPTIVDDDISISPAIKTQLGQKSEGITGPSLTKQETKPLSDIVPLTNEKDEKQTHVSTAVSSSQKSSTQKLTRKESPMPAEKVVESNPTIRTKSISLPSLHDVTEKSTSDVHGDSIIPSIRNLKKNIAPEPQQKTVAPQPIDVTIGRVEIRAIFPTEEKVIHAKKELKGVISLEDYLDQKRAKQ